MNDLFSVGYQCIAETSPTDKLRLTRLAAAQWRSNELSLSSKNEPLPITEPGRPAAPRLVPPQDVPRRSLGSKDGHAALLHAIVHIEFNAINLAWDAVYRFREMPAAFYSHWVKVADEEAYHFQLLRQRLWDLGYDYGDFPAHDGLWDMARRTAHDILERMALVPRVLEARGLDATPRIIERLRAINDTETIAILDIILRDEIGHVEIGSRWYKYCCEQRGLDPEHTFQALINRYIKGQLRGPFHLEARRKAGFSDKELQALQSMVS